MEHLNGNVFRMANLAVAGLMVAGGLLQFFPLGVQSSIVGSYVILFGAAVGILEFQIHPAVQRYGSFLFSFIGRGVFYIFVGSILFHDSFIRYLVGGLIAVIGAIYAALEFIPSIELPENMREDYGGEQV